MTALPAAVIPPHDYAAEAAILGAIMFSPGALERVVGRLSPTDFFIEGHERIFAAAVRVRAAGRAVDVITVRQALTDADELDAVGGPAKLALLMEEGAIAPNLDEYVTIVRELAAKRLLLAFAQELAHGAANGTSAVALLDSMKSVACVLAARTVTAEPTIVREGLDVVLTWPTGVRFALTAIRDSASGVRGELTVTHAGERRHWGDLTLSSPSQREALRKKLSAQLPGLPWGEYLEDACYRITSVVREGEPIVDLSTTLSAPAHVVMPRLLYAGNPTQIHGDGDTGKSMVALALLTSIQSGAALPGGLRPAMTGPCMYLDWEADHATHSERLHPLAAGLGIDAPAIAYKRMKRPLVDEAASIAAEIARRGVVAVVVDSMMFAVASGDGAFHEPITAFYGALRLFGPAAVLVLNHVTGADARSGATARPFGGAFAYNGPRLIWEAKRDQDVTDATAIAFTCRKANNLPRRPEPFGLRFVPGDGTTTIYPFDLAEASPQSVANTSVAWRIRIALAEGGRTAADLAESLAVDIDAVRKALQREKKHNRVILLDGNRWGLAER